MDRFPTLALTRYPQRAALMVAAAAAALALDFASKEIAVAVRPSTLVFNIGWRIGLSTTDASLIFVAAACSLLACILPARAISFSAGLALGGALGNLTSRPRWWESRGGTPDFIPFGDGSTGNVGDVFIAVGVSGMLAGVIAWLLVKLLEDRRQRGRA